MSRIDNSSYIKLQKIISDVKGQDISYEMAGQTSILGWRKEGRPLNHSDHLCTKEDETYVSNDIRNLLKKINYSKPSKSMLPMLRSRILEKHQEAVQQRQ